MNELYLPTEFTLVREKTTALQKSRVKGNTSYSMVKIHYNTLIDYYTKLK